MRNGSETLPRSVAPFVERRPVTTTVERARTGALADVLPFQVRDRFPSRARGALELSIVAPVYDEEENLERLHARVLEVFGDRTRWELILVDDGSRDRSPEIARALAARDPRVVGVFFGRNCGQTAAIAAGIQVASGRLIATIDADLQNDPADLPAMVELAARHDAVVGWRTTRRDNFVRRASSRIANAVRNRISGDSIRDTGCSLKVFRADVIQALPLFDGLHRFLPTLLRYHGFDVVEHGVRHHPRTAGRSKYGVWNRLFRSLRDLFAVRWMRARLLKLPIREVTRAPRA
jgi:glycosyltransferase involved in cell wall biosynthesis